MWKVQGEFSEGLSLILISYCFLDGTKNGVWPRKGRGFSRGFKIIDDLDKNFSKLNLKGKYYNFEFLFLNIKLVDCVGVSMQFENASSCSSHSHM